MKCINVGLSIDYPKDIQSCGKYIKIKNKIFLEQETEFSDLIGKKILGINVLINEFNNKENLIFFYINDFLFYAMYHVKDCCEEVYIEDIDGDINDLIGEIVLDAEEVIDIKDETEIFTFYKIRTNKSSITIRWLGWDGGYYSKEVSFYKFEESK